MNPLPIRLPWIIRIYDDANRLLRRAWLVGTESDAADRAAELLAGGHRADVELI